MYNSEDMANLDDWSVTAVMRALLDACSEYRMRCLAEYRQNGNAPSIDQTAGYAWYQFEGVFTEHPHLYLVWLAEFYSLFFGLRPQFDQYLIDEINKTLEDHTEKFLLSKFSTEDSQFVQKKLSAILL
jgi:hypothetical protein